MKTYDGGASTHGQAPTWLTLKRLVKRWLDRERELLALRNAVGMMAEARRADAAEYHEMSEALQAKWAKRVSPPELVEMEARKDAAYLERNQVVAALAKCFPSGIARTAIDGWSEDWHGCVYIDLPTGQASWHYHDSHAYLFESLPSYTKPWDEHDTPEKYRRLAALERMATIPLTVAMLEASRHMSEGDRARAGLREPLGYRLGGPR